MRLNISYLAASTDATPAIETEPTRPFEPENSSTPVQNDLQPTAEGESR